MNVLLSVVVADVEEDADIEVLRVRVEKAVQLSMPFNHVDATVEDCEK